jgi:hypothetical protein
MRRILAGWHANSGFGTTTASLILLILATLLMLPYVYSKTVRPTTTDDVLVA